MNSAEKWISEITKGAPALQVSKKAGISQGTYWRQVQENKLTPENAVKIARAYDAPIAHGLVAVGLVSADELELSSLQEDIETALRLAKDEQLVAEITRRLRDTPEGEGGIFDEPNPPVDLDSRRPDVSGAAETVESTPEELRAAKPRSKNRGEESYD